MPTEELLSDDYVASLLAKDAKTSNAKYSSYGLQELLPRRPTYNAPKPNTRFLKNIIRETDNHNAALRAKEIADSRSRLRDFHERSGTSSPAEGNGRLSRIADHRSKRRRVEGNDERSHRRTNPEAQNGNRTRSHRSDQRHCDHRYDDNSDEDGQSRRHHRRHHHRSRRHRSRSRSPDRSRGSQERRKSSRTPPRSLSRSGRLMKKHRHRRSQLRSRSRSPRFQDRERRREHQANSNSGHENTRFSPTYPTQEKGDQSPASDSDPLEAIIGPPPPPPEPRVKARGRGTFASTTAMDSHFSSSYDPKIDVQPDPDMDDDWDMALEALRDRQKWQKQGAERLKAAGFTEEEVQKWETGGEKREEDVRWRGRGEGREWDRGKVVGEDGVETKPEWGRLKGT